jgi:integrase
MPRGKDGVYRRQGGMFAFRYKDKLGCWKEKRCGTDNRDDAREFRDDFLRNLKDGTLPTQKARWTVAQAVAQWIEDHAAHLKADKSRSNEKSYSRQLVSLLGNRRLETITTDDLYSYQRKRTFGDEGLGRKPVHAAPINRELRILIAVLKLANLWKPLAEHYKPLPEDGAEIGRALTQEQMHRLEAIASTNPKWFVAFHSQILPANTGLRSGEIKKLQLGALDLENRRITVFRRTTKTAAGARMVELNQAATDTVLKLYERACLLGAKDPEDYLLPADLSRHTKAGDPLNGGRGFDVTRHQQSWATSWENLRNMAGPEFKGLRFHDLRHSFITWMAESGTPLPVVQSMVGHMSAVVTRRYTHISNTAAREAVEKLDRPVRGEICGEESPGRIM